MEVVRGVCEGCVCWGGYTVSSFHMRRPNLFVYLTLDATSSTRAGAGAGGTGAARLGDLCRARLVLLTGHLQRPGREGVGGSGRGSVCYSVCQSVC